MFIAGAAEFNSGDADASAVAVRALDDRTFEFETVGPLPYTLDALAHYSFQVVPLHAIEEFGSAWTLPENFVGNGPYTLAEWAPQQQIVLEPNPTYWNSSRVELDRVVFLPVEDDSTMYNMFVNGEIDWATNVPNGRIDEAQLRDDFHASAYLGTYYYVFNNTRGPLQDARVRQALALAIDRGLLVETVSRAGEVPAGTMVPEMTGYNGIDGVAMNVSRAQELLAEAGFPEGNGFPELTVLYNTNEGHKAIGEFIQQQWLDNLGISVTLENQEWGTYLNSRRQGEFDIARAGWIGDYQDPNTFLDMFVTGGAMNDAFFASAEYDRLIAEAAQMPAGADRFEVLAQAERLLIEEETAVMPIYYYVNKNMIDLDQWGGWYANIMGWHPVGAVAGM
jgi:oligopeptide transport system substrate-binding protein